jgi:hypothetical protein
MPQGELSYTTITIISQASSVSPRSPRTIDLKVKDQTLEEFPHERMTVRTNLDVASGSYSVRLVIKDSEGQIMPALNSAVVIP